MDSAFIPIDVLSAIPAHDEADISGDCLIRLVMASRGIDRAVLVGLYGEGFNPPNMGCE